MTDSLYRIQLSRHRVRVDGCSEHYTLVRIMRGSRELARAHSYIYASFADTVMSARSQARKEARFLLEQRNV